MAGKGKAKAPKQLALIAKRIEWLPIKSGEFSDRMLKALDKNIRKQPIVYGLFKNGKLVVVGQSEGLGKLRSYIMSNKKKQWWDRFAIYTLSKRKYLNDIEALTVRMSWPTKAAAKNFTRASNMTNSVKGDVNKWINGQMKGTARTLRPMEKRYSRIRKKLEGKANKLRKTYMKRIMKAKDIKIQKRLRAERDKRLKDIGAQVKKLYPWQKNITMLQRKMRELQKLKF